MWRKLLVGIGVFISLIWMGDIFQSLSMHANTKSSSFYGVGELFEETRQYTFLMGGWNWRIVYADESTGEGYIMGSWAKYDAAMHDEVNEALETIRQEYDLSNSDVIGDRVKSRNDVSQLKLMTLEEYDLITDHEKNINAVQVVGSDFWLDAFYDDEHKQRVYHYGRGSSPIYPGYIWLQYDSGVDASLGSQLYPVFKIKLPSKLNMIQSVTSDKKEQIKNYGEEIDPFQIHVVGGVGPFHFYLYDVDENGVGDDSIPSAYFSLDNIDINKGTAEVKPIQKFLSGDHYFRVKVIDECTDENLYSDSSDFTKDENRM